MHLQRGQDLDRIRQSKRNVGRPLTVWNAELLAVDRFCVLTAIFDVNLSNRLTTMTIRLPFLSYWLRWFWL